MCWEFVKGIKPYIKEIRPHQWIKNTFILAPLIFAQKLFVVSKLLVSVSVFFLFSLLTGAVYTINDIIDIEVDRKHPSKKNRPIASGSISVKNGIIFAILLGIVSLSATFFINFYVFLLFILYLILNSLYSIYLKHIIFVDVFIIASGFMLRVLIGAIAIEVYVSYWLILCSFLLSLFLALGKRRHELVIMENTGVKKRKVLEKYSLKHLDLAIYITAFITGISYVFYTISERTVHYFHTKNLVFTSIFIMFGLYRYIKILKNKKIVESPTDSMIKDVLFIINLLLWGVSVVVIIYATA